MRRASKDGLWSICVPLAGHGEGLQRQVATTWEPLQGCSDFGGCYCEMGPHKAVRDSLYY